WRDPRLDLEAALLQLAQGAGCRLHGVARLAKRALAGHARLDRGVELLAQRRDRIVGELQVEPADLSVAALDLLVDELDRAVDLRDLGAALALAEYRVVRLALGLLHLAALLCERGLRLH